MILMLLGAAEEKILKLVSALVLCDFDTRSHLNYLAIAI